MIVNQSKNANLHSCCNWQISQHIKDMTVRELSCENAIISYTFLREPNSSERIIYYHYVKKNAKKCTKIQTKREISVNHPVLKYRACLSAESTL